MNRRNRTMSDDMNVNRVYIFDVFENYLKGVYYVNRKYQRKLVWTLEEKEAFIDTILHKYPIPIFLVVKYKLDQDEYYRNDIIDGLQRFNAIISFIKNEFPVKLSDGKYYYFNTSVIAGADKMIEDGVLIQKTDTLDYAISRDFLNYPLPITITEVSDSEVEDIFRRINSTGRKLSRQDLRQAGAIGLFSDLVRKTACYIRGDITEKDVIPLADMPILSISNTKLDYGIDIHDTFWIKHGILTEPNIRVSRDEEIIARLYSYILLGSETSPSSNTLDRLYDFNSTFYTILEEKIEEYGILNLMDLFSKILSDFNNIFESIDSNFCSVIFSNIETKGKSKIFQIIFLSLFELREKNLFINDYKNIAQKLFYIGDKEFNEITKDEDWNIKIRNDAIRRFKSILEPLMVKRVISPTVNEEWKYKLEMYLLAAAGSEQQMYDFKLGIVTLQNGQKNTKCISSIAKTLTAMSNTKPNEEGIIIIGIANNLEAAIQHKNHYGTQWVEVNKCYVTGIDGELKKYWNNSSDNYCNFIKQKISAEPIQDDVKSQILRNFEIIDYQGKTLIIIKCKNNGHAFSYDKEFYERHGSNTEIVEIGSAAFNYLMLRTTVK